MKLCPKCRTDGCIHEKKFFNFGLAKILIIQRSLEATVTVFSTLATFLPTNSEMQSKLNLTYEELHKCQGRINDVKRWYESKITF